MNRSQETIDSRGYIFIYVEHYLVKHLITLNLLPSNIVIPHSSTLAWKIPWTEEPGRLPSMGSLRVRHD